MTRSSRHVLLILGVIAGIADSTAAQERSDGLQIAPASPGARYADGGSAACMKCHDETEEYPVLAILATQHAVQGDSRTPMASANECQTCHGPSAAHVMEPEQGEKRVSPAVIFGPDAATGPQKEACLSCHEGAQRMNWSGSPHDSEIVSCTSCHTIHAQEDPVMSKHMRPEHFFRKGQASVCFACHQEQRAQVYRVSSHPLREGRIECSSCHNPHGSVGPALLVESRINETCYTCHAEKRGPFLWEHPPVREDCTLCHAPHGSNHPTLLNTRVPQLCQQCHLAQFHPSTAYTGPDVANGMADFHTLERGCANCHSEVHGSNHPSGVRWTR